MTNETRNPKPESALTARAPFGLRASSFIRHSSFPKPPHRLQLPHRPSGIELLASDPQSIREIARQARDMQRCGAIEQHEIALRPGDSPSEDAFKNRGILRAVAAAKLVERRAREAVRGGIERESAVRVARDLAHLIQPRGRELIKAV